MTKGQAVSQASSRAPQGFRFYGSVAKAAALQFSPQVALRSIFCAALVVAAAAEAVRFGVVERPLSVYATHNEIDPVVAKVGHEVLRVSDAMAHALYTGVQPESAADLPALMASGMVDEAVDHLTLAQMAREEGLDRALEIRAAVALAEREILAEAFLEQIANRAASEERVRAAYEAEYRNLENTTVLRLSEIVVATREEALALRDRLPRASFSALASKKSLVKETAAQGGSLGDQLMGDLSAALRSAVQDLAIGGVTEPLETEQGWAIYKLSSRRAVRMPPFEERREEIARTLREEAVADALARTRGAVQAQIRSAEAILGDVAPNSAPVATLAAARIAN
ncbi:peptidylprolyl isomerase [Parvularcula maris]|uniref:Parvulin-like PPIase n=1 Tax=Parvularcula maris TaxID=2965077 RepID=A0A9X2L8Y7_9PROT|nr:peptidylprolyl isomerase [Parvularcula maris]MCQ8185245.1 peptidylprolyl isomerase [Parvularcula maris]